MLWGGDFKWNCCWQCIQHEYQGMISTCSLKSLILYTCVFHYIHQRCATIIRFLVLKVFHVLKWNISHISTTPCNMKWNIKDFRLHIQMCIKPLDWPFNEIAYTNIVFTFIIFIDSFAFLHFSLFFVLFFNYLSWASFWVKVNAHYAYITLTCVISLEYIELI